MSEGEVGQTAPAVPSRLRLSAPRCLVHPAILLKAGLRTPKQDIWAGLLCAKVGNTARTAEFNGSNVAWMCSSATLVAHLTIPYGVQGMEQDAPVTLCVLKAPIPQVWRRLRNFS